MFELQLASFALGMVFGAMCLAAGILIAMFVVAILKRKGGD